MDSSPEYFNEAIEAFNKVAEDNEVKYFLVGAYARDLFLKSIADNFGYRKTTDVDFAIMIDSWNEYQRFYNKLIVTSDFSKVGAHKVLFKESLEIDFVPFGSIVGSDGLLKCWPGEFDSVMNLSGFDEAYAMTSTIEVGLTEIKCIDVESFIVLKLFAWNDKPSREKDGQDIAYILKHYYEIEGRGEVVWNENNLDVIDLHEDYNEQVLRCIGREISRKFSKKVSNKIKEILINAKKQPFKLASCMLSEYSSIENVIDELSIVLDGINDV